MVIPVLGSRISLPIDRSIYLSTLLFLEEGVICSTLLFAVNYYIVEKYSRVQYIHVP